MFHTNLEYKQQYRIQSLTMAGNVRERQKSNIEYITHRASKEPNICMCLIGGITTRLVNLNHMKLPRISHKMKYPLHPCPPTPFYTPPTRPCVPYTMLRDPRNVEISAVNLWIPAPPGPLPTGFIEHMRAVSFLGGRTTRTRAPTSTRTLGIARI